jgi:hypothetical protein
MAISLEDANKVRQKTYGLGLDPLVYAQLKAFFQYWATHKGNASLQYIPFTSTTIDDAGGQVLADAACTLYFVYGRKGTLDQRTAGTATDAYLVMFDDATDDAGAGTDGRLVLPFLNASDSITWSNAVGIPMAAGVVAKAYTDFDGTTDSTAGDAPNGFVIIGA